MKKTILPLLLLPLLWFACNQEPTQAPAPITKLEDVTTVLPDSAGADLCRANCAVCHSLRYIQMQPDFPVKTWEKIVDKMRHTYGASISDSTAKIIVAYLGKIKGKK